MTDFKEVWTAVRDRILDRVSSPLSGAFAMAWSAWNYRFFLIAFSGETPHGKFGLINQYVVERTTFGVGGVWVNGVLVPLVIACVLIFLLPFPARWVLRYTRWQQLISRCARQKIEGEVLLSRTDSVHLIQRHARVEAELSSEVVRLHEQIEALLSVEADEPSIDGNERGPSSSSYDSSPELTPAQESLLNRTVETGITFESLEGGTTDVMISEQERAKRNLETLSRLGLVRQAFLKLGDEEGEPEWAWVTTGAGHNLWLVRGLRAKLNADVPF